MFYVWKLKKIIAINFIIIGIFLTSFACIKQNLNQNLNQSLNQSLNQNSNQNLNQESNKNFSLRTNNELEVFNANFEPSYTIVVDAGHGEPDGGAVSRNGIAEAGLNLEIALKLSEELEALGYRVILTRSTEMNIADADKQTPIRAMKVSDINNRIKIANESQADMLVSIHMNNFENSKYYGWQTFYQKNSEPSKQIAENIQTGISNQIERENNRVALPINNIKLIDQSKIPAIIVECGFLSNEEDLRLLLTEEYQMQIVNGIVEGIEQSYQ